MFKNRTKAGKIIGYSGLLIFLIGMFFLVEATNEVLRNILLIVGVAGILASNLFRIVRDGKQ
ncbi:hypothetical protein [Alkalihalobacterium sp. APHAB7]|uniref:hypothetical protein n=1 Tax=Alkalihalobacterium sp. APHAB7 TaxID=3402081 RepID=UPI003AAB6D46